MSREPVQTQYTSMAISVLNGSEVCTQYRFSMPDDLCYFSISVHSPNTIGFGFRILFSTDFKSIFNGLYTGIFESDLNRRVCKLSCRFDKWRRWWRGGTLWFASYVSTVGLCNSHCAISLCNRIFMEIIKINTLLHFVCWFWTSAEHQHFARWIPPKNITI